MTDTDPAFLWETAALRDSPQRIAEVEIDVVESVPAAGHWVTLREASRSTGIPVETLRKWARRDTIPTHLTATSAGPNIRMVDLLGVKRRAADLGRSIHPAPAEPTTAADQPVGSDPSPISPDQSEATAPGTMIVPVDAWNKMLTQLGNLHEAGQQLAEARERAAKAETEATFLRERLTELRNDPIPDPTSQPPAELVEPTVATTDPEPAPEKVWQFFVRRLRGTRAG